MVFRALRIALVFAAALAGTARAEDQPAASSAAPTAAPSGQIAIVYLALTVKRSFPESYLDQPPADEGLAGASVALADNNTTGRFTGQEFTLEPVSAPDEAGVIAAFRDRVGKGARAFVTDVPAPLLLKLADLQEARTATLIDATDSDDMLRAEGCRRNVLHVLPSRAMLADALMQYLVVKNWRRVMLLSGQTEADKRYAEAMRRAAKKFQIKIVADKAWTFNPAEQRADTGHFEVNTEVANITQGVDYDLLVVADEEDNFGDELGYRATLARPVAGTQGLVATAWTRVYDETGATQLQNRFLRAAHRWMTERDYGAWMAVRAFGEAAIRTHSSDPAVIGAYLRSPKFELAAFKGERLSFRAWDGQLRQPVLLADPRSLVSISPQPGFLHEFFETDTLGVDQPESTCHLN